MGNVNHQYFAQVTQTTVSLTSASTLLISQNKDRSFLHISNHSNHDIFISLGTEVIGEAGIYLSKTSTYEFSYQKGNLYDGNIYAKCKENQNIIVTVVEGYGI